MPAAADSVCAMPDAMLATRPFTRWPGATLNVISTESPTLTWPSVFSGRLAMTQAEAVSIMVATRRPDEANWPPAYDDETAAEARPQPGAEMKAAWQAGLLRQAFDQQRDTLVALVQAIDEQLKRAVGVVADHARAIAAAIAGDPDAAPGAPRPPEPPTPSARGPRV